MKKTSELKTYPKWLARLQNEIAGNLPGKQSKDWTARLLNAVETNTNLEDCKHRFLARLLRECLVFDRDAYPKCADAINAIAELHDQWTGIDPDTWAEYAKSAWSAAESATSAAWAAAWAAARSAARSDKYAWSAAKSAAESAAWSAWSAAWSASSAAESAAWSAAKSAAWLKIADILIEELER